MVEGKGKSSHCGGVISPHATNRKHLPFRNLFFKFVSGSIATLFLSAITLMAIPPFPTQASGVTSPSTSPALAAVASNIPVGSPVVSEMSAASDGTGGSDVYEPPVVGQGGNCIKGSIIDLYDAPIGAGWTIKVFNPPTDYPNGTVFDTINAEADGTFYFPSLAHNVLYPAGTYILTLDPPPAGYQAFTPITFSVTLNGSEAPCAVVRFKFEALAKLCVTKQDVGVAPPVGLPGFEITVTSLVTGKVWTGKTDGLGIICFPDLPPGDYQVKETNQVGWQIFPAWHPVGWDIIHLVSPHNPGIVTNFVFSNKQVHDGTICVTKTDDSGNLLNGWTITLTSPLHQVAPRITGADAPGIACFYHLALGDWTATETAQTWWQITSTSANPQIVHLNTPGEIQNITFVNKHLGCVDGYKINDLDQGLPGWKITAQKGTEIYTATTLTTPPGYFQFYLDLGTWTISETMQNGWTPVTLASFDVIVTKPGVCEHVRFKNATKYACVDVYKKDAYDGTGLPGWTISLAPAYGDGTATLTGLTDGSGLTRFNGLTPGDYTIWETLQTGWTYVSHPNGIMPSVNLKATGMCKVVVFTNRQTNRPVQTLLDP